MSNMILFTVEDSLVSLRTSKLVSSFELSSIDEHLLEVSGLPSVSFPS